MVQVAAHGNVTINIPNDPSYFGKHEYEVKGYLGDTRQSHWYPERSRVKKFTFEVKAECAQAKMEKIKEMPKEISVPISAELVIDIDDYVTHSLAESFKENDPCQVGFRIVGEVPENVVQLEGEGDSKAKTKMHIKPEEGAETKKYSFKVEAYRALFDENATGEKVDFDVNVQVEAACQVDWESAGLSVPQDYIKQVHFKNDGLDLLAAVCPAH